MGREVKPVKIKLTMEDIVAILKPRSSFTWCGREGQPSVDIEFDTQYDDKPRNADDAADKLRDAWEF